MEAPGKIKPKASLFSKGLWDVVENGPTATQASPASVTPGNNNDGTTPQEWYYAERDNTVRGPCSAEKLTEVFNYISQNELLTGESVYVFHQNNTAGIWEPWSMLISRKVHTQSSLEKNVRNLRSLGTPESTVNMLNFGASPTVSARDRELGQQRPCTKENNRAAFHSIIDGIDDAADSIPESLLLTIHNKFENNESGHKLFAWLEETASCSSGSGGLVDADEVKAQAQD